jgi:chromosome segregation ATPase
MRPTISLVRVAGVILGALGIAVCLAVIAAAWATGNRLEQATERLLGSTERALSVAGERLAHTQQRVAEVRTSAEDLEKSLLGRSTQDAGQREVLQQAVAVKVEKLAHVLEQIDLWLQSVESTVERVNELLTSGTTVIPASVFPASRMASISQLVDELAGLRTRITEANTAIARIQQRVGDSSEAPLGRGDPLVRRLLAPLDSIDSRFVAVERRLSAARSEVQNLSARVQRWILMLMIGGTLLMLWMAAGQAALGWSAWNSYRHRQPGSSSI